VLENYSLCIPRRVGNIVAIHGPNIHRPYGPYTYTLTVSISVETTLGHHGRITKCLRNNFRCIPPTLEGWVYS
jgi:hypothetical protein